jgi:hypothetical protein
MSINHLEGARDKTGVHIPLPKTTQHPTLNAHLLNTRFTRVHKVLTPLRSVSPLNQRANLHPKSSSRDQTTKPRVGMCSGYPKFETNVVGGSCIKAASKSRGVATATSACSVFERGWVQMVLSEDDPKSSEPFCQRRHGSGRSRRVCREFNC